MPTVQSSGICLWPKSSNAAMSHCFCENFFDTLPHVWPKPAPVPAGFCTCGSFCQHFCKFWTLSVMVLTYSLLVHILWLAQCQSGCIAHLASLVVPFCVFVAPVKSCLVPFLLQTCLVTFAYMAAQWPSYLAQFPGTSPCSQQSWPQGPSSLWLWLCQWNNCRRFNDSYLILWGSRQA